MNKKTLILFASEEQKNTHKEFIQSLSHVFEIKPQEKLQDPKNQDDILIIGGDGSLNYLINYLDSTLSQHNIIYLPTGTANDFAKTLNIVPSQPSVTKVQSILRQDRLIKVPLIACNDKKFINVASAGAPARVTNSGSNLLKKFIGKASYYLSSIDKLLSNEQYEITLTNSSNKDTQKFLTKGFVISQGLYAGGGVRVSTNYCPNFGRTFNFVSPGSIKTQEIINSMMKLQDINNDFSKLDLKTYQFTEIKIQSNQIIPVKLDGEEYESKELLFKKLEVTLNFYSH